MSNVNIKRAVENIRSVTTVYTPIVEVIVNAIQAIEAKALDNGSIEIIIERSAQDDIERGIRSVESFLIKDNGVGFTQENRDSFDTLYSDYKLSQGGKGFGRFTCLKYFENLKVKSVFECEEGFKQRTFKMGKGNDIIVDEQIAPTKELVTFTTIKLENVKDGKFLDKKLTTIAKSLVERLLPYFIDDSYHCPKISIAEKDGTGLIVLNDFINNQLSASIKEIPLKNTNFVINGLGKDHTFLIRLFKFYSPKNQRSKISLVAHRREVTDTAIHTYIPEFIEEFLDKDLNGEDDKDRNYVLKAYVYGDYLDDNVSLERGGFEFHKDNDLMHGVSQSDIEKVAAEISREAIGDEIDTRQVRKRERVQEYVDNEAPWHRQVLKNIDLSSMSYNPSKEEIELKLQEEKHRVEIEINRKVKHLLAEGTIEDLKLNVNQLVSEISDTSKNDLIHYIALRRKVLDLFGKNLELDPEGKYFSEGAVHDIIFPRRKDTDNIAFNEHNLWIIDERLNFTNYVSSDRPLNEGNTDRPDLLAYDRRILFRGDNEASNPVTIFEFKKPQRDDFVNPSSTEDPVQQIVRYVNQVREGKFKTPEGRKIHIAQNTPFYGYVVCDLTQKVENWLEFEKDYKPMPDRLGWFRWHDNINLYMEVISWDKVLRDAEMRNRIFFHHLGIS
ncbi:ATP-binding protein [Cellvibrio sp. KY-GH-1]|uniref:ATP-binding protein n=1 Tax=Cellvibrio sp. KY-GH-1 TaxID=2303332 RepID=UPI0012450264|nr:ATP-binding protein [Cellvibrio sp. KY-GH-1]QEY15786.1 ATP-binding protein [Cellvibrio sp. KY-GH-1]